MLTSKTTNIFNLWPNELRIQHVRLAGGWFVLREKYCWLVADKPSEQADSLLNGTL
jgi:hypothetical protein